MGSPRPGRGPSPPSAASSPNWSSSECGPGAHPSAAPSPSPSAPTRRPRAALPPGVDGARGWRWSSSGAARVPFPGAAGRCRPGCRRAALGLHTQWPLGRVIPRVWAPGGAGSPLGPHVSFPGSGVARLTGGRRSRAAGRGALGLRRGRRRFAPLARSAPVAEPGPRIATGGREARAGRTVPAAPRPWPGGSSGAKPGRGVGWGVPTGLVRIQHLEAGGDRASPKGMQVSRKSGREASQLAALQSPSGGGGWAPVPSAQALECRPVSRGPAGGGPGSWIDSHRLRSLVWVGSAGTGWGAGSEAFSRSRRFDLEIGGEALF